MNLYLTFLVLIFLVGCSAAAGVAFLGYKWGAFAALEALAQNSPKWKAYVLSLLPPAAFALAFLFDVHLSRFAYQAFWVLTTPALIGTCFTYNHRSDSAF